MLPRRGLKQGMKLKGEWKKGLLKGKGVVIAEGREIGGGKGRDQQSEGIREGTNVDPGCDGRRGERPRCGPQSCDGLKSLQKKSGGRKYQAEGERDAALIIPEGKEKPGSVHGKRGYGPLGRTGVGKMALE